MTSENPLRRRMAVMDTAKGYPLAHIERSHHNGKRRIPARPAERSQWPALIDDAVEQIRDIHRGALESDSTLIDMVSKELQDRLEAWTDAYEHSLGSGRGRTGRFDA